MPTPLQPVRETADQVRETAGHARRHPLETLGRVGYAVKGAVYVLLGWIAFQAALGNGAPEGQTGTLAAMAESPFGGLLLGLTAVGLAAYALWRVALAALDPEGEGSDAKGLATRAFFLVSAAAYGGLAWTAFRLRQGAPAGGDGTQERTATLLEQPFGRALVGALALGLVAYAGREFYRAYTAHFMERLDLSGPAAANRDRVRQAGQAGLAARGVVYLILGGFLARAALQADAAEARGLDGALSALQGLPAGPFLLGLAAVGLAAYGAYCLVNARYRRFVGRQ